MRERFSIQLIAIGVVMLVGVWRVPLSAQQFSGTLRGTVQDSSGALVPAADVTVVLVATNETQTVTTDNEGAYVVPNLKPGTYRITVAKQGFKSAAVAEVKLDVQQIRSVNVTLELVRRRRWSRSRVAPPPSRRRARQSVRRSRTSASSISP